MSFNFIEQKKKKFHINKILEGSIPQFSSPLEALTGINIEKIDDIILDYKLTSLLIYCYKNQLNLIDWINLIPHEIVTEIGEGGKFADMENKTLEQDLMVSALFSELIKLKDWFVEIPIKEIYLNIEMIIQAIAMENIKRTFKNQWNDCEDMFLIEFIDNNKSKFDWSNIQLKANHDKYDFKFENENEGSITIKDSNG